MCSFKLEFIVNYSLSLLFYFKWILKNLWSSFISIFFTISVNFLDQLVTDLCEPVLKD